MLVLIYCLSAHSKTISYTVFKPPPPPPPPVYKPTQNPLRTCISPELISGILRYFLWFKLGENQYTMAVLQGLSFGFSFASLI